jgi:hypothetical protein
MYWRVPRYLAHMSKWQRLSVRRGMRPPMGLQEGVPSYMSSPLIHWVEEVFGFYRSEVPDLKLLQEAALVIQVPIEARRVPRDPSDSLRNVYDRRFGQALFAEIVNHCHHDEDTFLDLIDYLLSVPSGIRVADELESVLRLGGSAWAVNRDSSGLQRRVNDVAQKSYEEAASHGDSASEELRQAWDRAFSRNPNPSDAWDHAIKALEAILIPLVVPNQSKPNLGHVTGTLRGQGARWQFVLPGSSMKHRVDPLLAALDSVWPNPDRHGAGARREPTQAEAEAVVHLTVTVVQWARSGALTLHA